MCALCSQSASSGRAGRWTYWTSSSGGWVIVVAALGGCAAARPERLGAPPAAAEPPSHLPRPARWRNRSSKVARAAPAAQQPGRNRGRDQRNKCEQRRQSGGRVVGAAAGVRAARTFSQSCATWPPSDPLAWRELGAAQAGPR